MDASHHMAAILPRQTIVTDENGNRYLWEDPHNFWNTTTGNIVKWIIFMVLLSAVVGFFVIGRLLAQKKLKQGVPPARWNRWLLSRRQRAEHEPRFRWPENQVSLGAYSTTHPHHLPFPDPAPAYNPHLAPPPQYTPPAGATKVDPDQTYVRLIPEGAPPDVPPAAYTGASRRAAEPSPGTNPFR